MKSLVAPARVSAKDALTFYRFLMLQSSKPATTSELLSAALSFAADIATNYGVETSESESEALALLQELGFVYNRKSSRRTLLQNLSTTGEIQSAIADALKSRK